MTDNASPNTALLEQLLKRLAAEEQRAHEKMANPAYWRDVGHIELAAVYDIRQCLQRVPETLPFAQYQSEVTAALQKLAATWRTSSRDEDGYGVATVHSVGKLLPDYAG